MKQLYANNAKTTLASGITASSTVLTVADGSKFPSPGANEYFLVTLELGGAVEIIMITARTSNTLTIGGLMAAGQTTAGRGQEGTTAQSFGTGARVECRVTKGTLDKMSRGLAQIASADLMVSPGASYQDGYVVNTLDPAGNPLVAVARDTSTWRFLNYTTQMTDTVLASTTTSITGNSIPISDVSTGKYLIQFTSGDLAGTIRPVASIVANVVNWTTAYSSAPAVGSSYEILKANTSIINDALANMTFPISTAGGTVNAITASYPATATSLTDNLTVLVVLSGANTITNPTFSPNSLTAKVIKKNTGEALDIGQLNGTVMLRYESSSDDWRLVSVQPTSSTVTFELVSFYLGNL